MCSGGCDEGLGVECMGVNSSFGVMWSRRWIRGEWGVLWSETVGVECGVPQDLQVGGGVVVWCASGLQLRAITSTDRPAAYGGFKRVRERASE